MSRTRLLVLACLVISLHSCTSESKTGRIIVLGLDGMDPQTVDLLMSEGKMPNFAKLRREGAYGRLLSSRPLLSPIIWTTIATGKTPDQHGIGHFIATNEKTGEQLPVTSQMRRVKALWNILSDAGRRVGVVGWWATWPAETVRGTIVSDHACYHFLFEEGSKELSDLAGVVYPADLEATIEPMIRRPGDLTMQDLSPFVDVASDDLARPFDFDDDLSHFRWALATAETYERIGRFIWHQEQPDLLMVYIEATDSTAHLFGHLFRARGLAGELAEQQKRYGNAVEAMYEYADSLVGNYLEAMDDRTTLMVLSDHGFALGVLPDDPSKTRDMRRVSERYHRPEGILYLYGNHVKRHSRIDRPTVIDIAPTLLTLAGLPAARDMPGRVLSESLDIEPVSPSVASYEKGGQQHAARLQTDAPVDPVILERLRLLGYLDAESPQGERNLAAVQFQAGRYPEAVEAYEKLVRADPDDGALRASLAGALGALGRYEEAMEQLNVSIRLAPLSPEAHHNRGVIHERQGNRDAAIADYRTALRYNPEYRPSREALSRLTGSAQVDAPASDGERLALKILARASAAARHGDYDEAASQLDEAQRVAPDLPLLYQYRSNVAFLMGDREAAIAALHRALELEPDNALFQANLQRLEHPGTR